VYAVLAVLLVLAVGALIAEGAGLELPIGAMASGVLLARCPPPPEAARRALSWFTTRVCAPLFLGAAGMKLDLHVLGTGSVLLSGVVLLVLAGAGKVAGGYLGARSAGVPHATALATGAGLNARGMVEILIASIGLRIELISPAMYGILVGIAVVTSIVTPMLLRWLAPREAMRSRTEPPVLDDKAAPAA
jgi:Kef-type K+ transport system membrane component KefB